MYAPLYVKTIKKNIFQHMWKTRRDAMRHGFASTHDSSLDAPANA